MFHSGKIKLSDLSLMIQQFSILLESGLALMVVLEILHRETTDIRLKEIITSLKENVEQGKSLSESMILHASSLPGYVISMVSIAEETGKLPEIFRQLAGFIQRRHQYQRMIMHAMLYPAILIGVAAVSIGFMLFEILPAFMQSMHASPGTLPVFTRFLLTISEFLKSHLIVLPPALAALVLSMLYVRNSRSMIMRTGKVVIKMPLLGYWIRKFQITHFLTHLNLLFRNEVDIVRALSIVQKNTADLHLKVIIQRISNSIRSGSTLHEAFCKVQVFPFLVEEMIRIGEESSRLSHVLEKLVYHYNLELTHRLTTFTQLLEPVLIIMLGIIIGGIIIAIYLPLFQMVNQVPF